MAKHMVDTRHDLSITVFKLEAIENDDFRENVKYLISQKLLDIYEIWWLLRTQCQKVVVKLWLQKH